MEYNPPINKTEYELRKENEEILESLELEGMAVERLPGSMHPNGIPGYRFVSVSELFESKFSRYSRSRLSRLSGFKIHGKGFLDALGLHELMRHEELAFAGELTTRGSRPGEQRGGKRR